MKRLPNLCSIGANTARMLIGTFWTLDRNGAQRRVSQKLGVPGVVYRSRRYCPGSRESRHACEACGKITPLAQDTAALAVQVFEESLSAEWEN